MRDQLRRKVDVPLAELPNRNEGEVVTVGGIVASIRTTMTRKGDPMAFIRLDDAVSTVEVVVFSSAYAAAREHLYEDRVLVVKGRVDRREEGETKVVALEVTPFDAVPLTGEVRVRVDARTTPASFVDGLGRAIRDFPGTNPVVVEMSTADGPAAAAPRPGLPRAAGARLLRRGARARRRSAARLRPGSARLLVVRPGCDNDRVSGPTILELELDLDAYAGPFDLLLALVLREELELVEVPIAEIVIEYIERLSERDELDLEAVSEFLLLVAALCEVKVRRLLGEADADVEEQGPEEAAAELAARLAEYQRFRAAAGWLGERRDELGRRIFRTVRAPLGPKARPADLRPERPAALAEALARLLEPPARLDIGAVRGRSVPVGPFLRRFRDLLRTRGTFLFDEQVDGLEREEQAAAFLALLELYKRGELRAGQAEPFGPIRVARTVGLLAGTARRRRCPSRPWHDGRADPRRRGAALREPRPAHASPSSPRPPRRRPSGSSARSTPSPSGMPRGAAASCSSASRAATASAPPMRRPRRARGFCSAAPDRALSPAALETLAVIAYLQPVARPEIARIRGVSADGAVAGLLERGMIEEAGRTDERGGAVLYRTTPVFDRVFGLEHGLDDLPPLPQPGETDVDDLRERLHAVAGDRTG